MKLRLVTPLPSSCVRVRLLCSIIGPVIRATVYCIKFPRLDFIQLPTDAGYDSHLGLLEIHFVPFK